LGSQGGSAAARLSIWQATLDLIVQRPWLGYGPDALELVFPQVYPPQLVYYQGRGLLVDRAHNLFLDWTIASGVLGLLTFLTLLTVFFVTGWRAAQRTAAGEQRAWLIACLASVAGSVAGNLVSFDVTPTAAATWLLMALAVAVTAGNRPAYPVGGRKSQPRRDLPRGMAAGLVAGIAAIVGTAILMANARPLAADVAARSADRRSYAGDLPGAARAGEWAVALWPVEPAHRLALSWTCLQMADTGTTDPLPWLQRAEAELLAARELRPDDYRTWAALGELYGVWGNRWDREKLAQAHEAYQGAVALAPQHAILYTSWGMVDLEGGQLEQAAARFRQAVELDATDGYAFSHLGDVELALGRIDDALAAYQQAAHWEPELSHAHLGLARCYWRRGEKRAAALSLERALQLDPGSTSAWDLRQEMEANP
jgi:tetratricopeptide (TPR) repeat protein